MPCRIGLRLFSFMANVYCGHNMRMTSSLFLFQKVIGHKFRRLWHRQTIEQQKPSNSTNKLRRDKSLSCPHLLLPDFSGSLNESTINVKKGHYNRNNKLKQSHIKTHKQGGESHQVGEIERLRKSKPPRSSTVNKIRLIASLPKELRMQPPFRRRIETEL